MLKDTASNTDFPVVHIHTALYQQVNISPTQEKPCYITNIISSEIFLFHPCYLGTIHYCWVLTLRSKLQKFECKTTVNIDKSSVCGQNYELYYGSRINVIKVPIFISEPYISLETQIHMSPSNQSWLIQDNKHNLLRMSLQFLSILSN